MYWRNIKYGILVGGLLLLPVYFSCKKVNWYEARPDSNLAVPTTLTDFQALMDNAELFTRTTPALGEAGSDGHYVQDGTFLSTNSFNAYTWSHEQPYTSIDEWNQLGIRGAYTVVYYCNLVLEGLEKYKTQHSTISTSELRQWNDIHGQALFYRAKAFFDIAQVFAPPYDSTTAATDLGIPLRLSTDAEMPSVRSTVQQTYQQVTDDLKAAITQLITANVPNSVLLKCRATKTAVLALLARIYLAMGKYEEATSNATLAINSYGVLADYNTFNNPAGITAFNEEVLLHSTMSSQFIPVQPLKFRVDSDLYKLYDENDLRKTLFFGKNSSANPITWKCPYAGASVLFSGLTTAELYLIRAEGAARARDTTQAMRDVNALLKSRWVDTVPYTRLSAANAEDALRIVLLERKKELLLRGLRWSDLRRLNRGERFKDTLHHTVAGRQYDLLPGSYKYTFPIPDDVLRLSTMPQNPGW
jgi:starch-binding outer membrane protein, SusD/RagB family